MNDAVLNLKNITRTYTQGGNALHVLNRLNLDVKPGEVVALVGPSGSGKTTLLQIAGLLDTPDDGEVFINNEAMHHASDTKRTSARSRYMGFIYQFHHLLPEFTALENVAMPQMIAGIASAQATQRARELLSGFGLAERIHHRPAKLSGGEQQRVAIARALANKPKLLLADEPTGNLDAHTAESVFSALMQAAKERQLGALVATHNLDLARRMDRIVRLEEGVLKT